MEPANRIDILEGSTEIMNAINSTTTSPETSVFLDSLILTAGISGVAVNAFTFIVLFWTSSVSTVTSLLLKHQAFADFLVCLMACCIAMQPEMWGLGYPAIDTAICHLWHSQGPYWGAIFLVAWNLVVLATERMLAICRPFTYSSFTKIKVLLVFVSLYITSVLCNLPAYFEVKFIDGVCEEDVGFEGSWFEEYYFYYALFYFLVVYFLPCILFFILYGMIIVTMRRRRVNSGQSKVMNKVATQLTRSAIVVTLIFIVTIGPDSWLYLLSTFNLAEYKYSSPLQKVTILLTMLNSCSNPIVYLCTLPSYRRDVIRLLRLARSENNDLPVAIPSVATSVSKLATSTVTLQSNPS